MIPISTTNSKPFKNGEVSRVGEVLSGFRIKQSCGSYINLSALFDYLKIKRNWDTKRFTCGLNSDELKFFVRIFIKFLISFYVIEISVTD